MSTLSWKDEYSVGVQEIDDEHKDLISLINKAEEARKESSDFNAVAKVASEMSFYALTHFSNEEVLMLSVDYPDFEEHREQHREFAKTAKLIEDSLTEGEEPPNSQDVFQYLFLWLIDHILISDKKLGVFLNDQGIS